MTSVCVKENTWPTCSDPLTVGGGVSIAKTAERGCVRSKRYTPASSHRAIHLSSRPSRAGFSGVFNNSPTRQLANFQLSDGGLDALDLFLHEPLGDGRHDLGDRLAHDAVRQLIEDTARHLVDEAVGDGRRGRGRPRGPRDG